MMQIILSYGHPCSFFMQNAIDITLHFPIQIIQKERWYVASCLMLDVHSQGDTAEQAQTNLFEALKLFLTSCFDRGTLEAVLKECGFRPEKSSLSSEGTMIHVPIHLFQHSNYSHQCRA